MPDMDLGRGAKAVQVDGPGAFSTLFNWLGAAMSVALVAGLAVWGYQLAMRDVTGIPVVRALEGPMRIAPEDPGGQQALHQGLAVNSVAADGAAAAPADRLILAPAPLDLADEDLPRPQLAEAMPIGHLPVPRPAKDEIIALADALAEDVVPLSATISELDGGADVIPASVKGVSRSIIPRPRPIGDLTAEAVANTVGMAVALSSASVEVDASDVAVGTRMVQFGAFDSPEVAREEWAKLDVKFTDFLRGKQRVVQQAESGGKTFYRLRAVGFEDINDARRFCSALLAERQACIPVVVR